ncbi:hypothetical protein DEU56DRAFT_981007 [Suillus clintonianus]|uniref:uncharacterized protein n=1 Tax=Suillus clintonianus TaxID=1904413 RepID=UPI001B87AA8B|nr:uncharacterized protein DEU56DRAFT_981007 [Suillus clintonianus]KAG2135804.1 hypothetical protein DEU56DRAFT_981007 [Suillus clintonianus]
MDEYASLADARSRMNKGTDTSTLTEALDECETLKMRIDAACRKCLEDEIRRGPVPVATAAAESPDASIAPVDPDPSSRTPPSEGPILAQSNSTMTSGNSSRLFDPSTSTDSLVPSDIAVARATTSSDSAASTEGSSYEQPVKHKDCMIFDRGSFAGPPTFNIDSEDATGATHTFMVNRSSARLPRQRRPVAGAYQLQTKYTLNGGSNVYFGPKPVSTEGSLYRSPVTTRGCMIFGPGSFVGSPTFNCDSQDSIGSITYTGNSPFVGLPGKRQPQTTYTLQGGSNVYFGPGSEVDSPTFNILSSSSSGSKASTTSFSSARRS